jgi:hypothetical protein
VGTLVLPITRWEQPAGTSRREEFAFLNVGNTEVLPVTPLPPCVVFLTAAALSSCLGATIGAGGTANQVTLAFPFSFSLLLEKLDILRLRLLLRLLRLLMVRLVVRLVVRARYVGSAFVRPPDEDRLPSNFRFIKEWKHDIFDEKFLMKIFTVTAQFGPIKSSALPHPLRCRYVRRFNYRWHFPLALRLCFRDVNLVHLNKFRFVCVCAVF